MPEPTGNEVAAVRQSARKRRWLRVFAGALVLLGSGSGLLWWSDRQTAARAAAVCAQLRGMPTGTALQAAIESAGADFISVPDGDTLQTLPAAVMHADFFMLRFESLLGWTWHECVARVRDGRVRNLEVRSERRWRLPFAPPRF